LVVATSTLAVLLVSYVSLNIEYQGDKLVLAHAGTGLVQIQDQSGLAPTLVALGNGRNTNVSTSKKKGGQSSTGTGGIYEEEDDATELERSTGNGVGDGVGDDDGIYEDTTPLEAGGANILTRNDAHHEDLDASPFKIAARALYVSTGFLECVVTDPRLSSTRSYLRVITAASGRCLLLRRGFSVSFRS
jgi:hypothetical protein